MIPVVQSSGRMFPRDGVGEATQVDGVSEFSFMDQ